LTLIDSDVVDWQGSQASTTLGTLHNDRFL